MAWVRSGECTRCGDCCRGDPPNLDQQSAAMQQPPAVEGYCPLFSWLSPGYGFCAGHEPPNQDVYYLGGCNVWPTDPEQIADKPNCGYTFTWVPD